MPLNPLVAKIVAIVDKQVAGGAHWGTWSNEIAQLAVKRWATYTKRHPKAKRVHDWERVSDLAKGFRIHFNPDGTDGLPDSEWKWLAETLLPILREHETDVEC